MAGVNKVILVGNLGKDPEVNTLQTGVKVARFSLATTERFKDKNNNVQETTEWHNIVLLRWNAELAEKYLAKGSQIYLEGKIRTRKWQDKEGKDRYTTDIEGQTIVMMGSKKDTGGASPADEPMPPTIEEELPPPGDDLPF